MEGLDEGQEPEQSLLPTCNGLISLPPEHLLCFSEKLKCICCYEHLSSDINFNERQAPLPCCWEPFFLAGSCAGMSWNAWVQSHDVRSTSSPAIGNTHSRCWAPGGTGRHLPGPGQSTSSGPWPL